MKLRRMFFISFALLIATLTSLQVAVAVTVEEATAVFLVSFPDNTSRPLTRDDADKMVFTDPASVSNRFFEMSYQKLRLTGTVYDWIQLPINASCNKDLLMGEIVKSHGSSVNFRSYKNVLIISPNPGNCNDGYGGGGSWITWGGETFYVFTAWAAAHPYTTMLSSNTTVQELGHSMGVGSHANAYECGNLAFATEAICAQSVGAGEKVLVDSGNPYDPMGSGMGHFNGLHKEMMGWLEPSSVVTVTQNKDYPIEALEIASPNPKLLKILIGATNTFKWFYVDYRQPLGFDANLVGNMFRGASVYYVDGQSYLLDTTPGSKADQDGDRRDGALEPQNEFSYQISGVTLKLTTLPALMPDGTPDPNRITVRVAGVPPPPPCEHKAPYVQAGVNAPSMGKAGATLSYTVTVTNDDYLSCAPSTFSLQVLTPNGWSSPSPVKLLNVNPQGNATATISVTSPSGAADGLYPLVFTASNDDNTAVCIGSATGCSGSANADYILDSTRPTVAITSPSINQFVKGTVNFAATASDNFFVQRVDFIACPGIVGTVINNTFRPYTVPWDTTQWADGNCFISALVYDLAGNLGLNQRWVTIDNTVPPVPGSVKAVAGIAVAGTSLITVTWAASKDNIGVAAYEIRRTNSLGATAFFTVSGQTLSYIDMLPTGTTMKYQVRARDKAGNVSLFSPIAKVTAR